MRNFLTAFLLGVFSLSSLNAENVLTGEQLLQKLSSVNTEWRTQKESYQIASTIELTDNGNSSVWIATHLKLVEQTLRSRDISTLSVSQQSNRLKLLNELNSYWHTRAFPVNDYKTYKTPVFIDRTGNHCAVGYLMEQSGAENLAQQISREQKFAYVNEIKVDGVNQWADENGFTLQELAWIQPTYWPSTQFSAVGGGTNGPVKVLSPDWSTGKLIVAGAFDTVGNLPCANIGYYKSNQLNCFGDGLEGVVNAIFNNPPALIAGGNLQSGGNNFPLANYDTAGWHFQQIPNRQGAVCTALFGGGIGVSLEAAINHSSIPGKQEIWYQDYAQNWEKQATVNGVILDIEASYYGRIYVGSFDSVIVTRSGMSDTIIFAHNVVFKDNNSENWFGIGSEVSDTVLVARNIGNAIYFGGVCSSVGGQNNICLSRYLNNTLQPIVLSSYFPANSNSITDIQLYDFSNLILAGEFEIVPGGIGTYSKNVALYRLAYDYIYAFGYFNEKVNSLVNWGSTWYLGGDFTSNHLGDSLSHLARIGVVSGVNEIGFADKLKFYPNPTTDIIHIETSSGFVIQQTELLDITGRILFTEKNNNVLHDVSVSELPAGIYLLRALTTNGWSTARVVKQ